MIRRIKKYLYQAIFNRSYPSFYFVNAIGWLIFISLDSTVLGAQYEWRLGLSAYIANFLQWSMGYLVTSLMRIIYNRFYKSNINFWLKLLYVSFVSIVGALWLFALALFVFSLYFYPNIIETLLEYGSTKYFLYRMTQLIPMMTAWSMLYFGIRLWFDVSSEKEKTEKANLLTQNAQLQMLRYQVNPHFLFNSFSSLRALIRKNPKAAAEMVTKLSEFYRYSLLPKSNSKVTIKNEIEAIQFYVDIEKIRFGERVQFNFDIDEDTEDCLIPNFIIHPLVENAVKYGTLTSKVPLIISIKTFFHNNDLVIEVANSGRWYTDEKNDRGTGTGITNIKNRLDLLFKENYSFNPITEDNLVKVEIKLNRELT